MKESKKAVPLCAGLAVLVLLSGCASHTVEIAADSYCGVTGARPICIDKGDRLTEQTATQIEGRNVATQRLCKPVLPCQAKKKRATVAVPTV